MKKYFNPRIVLSFAIAVFSASNVFSQSESGRVLSLVFVLPNTTVEGKEYLRDNNEELTSSGFVYLLSKEKRSVILSSKNKTSDFISKLYDQAESSGGDIYSDLNLMRTELTKFMGKGYSKINVYLLVNDEYIEREMSDDKTGALLNCFSKELSFLFNTKDVKFFISSECTLGTAENKNLTLLRRTVKFGNELFDNPTQQSLTFNQPK